MGRWNSERCKRAVDLYLSGMSMERVCKTLKAGLSTLRKTLLENGVQLRLPKKVTWGPEQIAECAQLYQSGLSQEKVAHLLGVSQSKVRDALNKEGIQSRHFWTEEKGAELAKMYLSGATLAECYHHFQTSHKMVRTHLEKLNIEIRPYIPHKLCKSEKHGRWKGGRRLDKNGYVYLRKPNHPHCNSVGYVFEHRIVMEEHLGRYLTPEEVVHHKDKNKQNNSIDNLELFSSNADHLRHELQGQCPKWSEDGKRRIVEARRLYAEQERKKSRPKSDAQPSLRWLSLFET